MGETLEDAARRELREELDLRTLAVGRHLFSHQDPGSRFLIQFVEDTVVGEPRPVEHSELTWVDVPALGQLPLAPSDKAFVEWLASTGDRQRV